MAWLDDRAWCHPKLVNLSDKAHRAYVNALSYSAGMGLRGMLTEPQQRLMGATPALRRELIESGLWDDLKGPISIHDWKEHNGKRDERRQRDKERKRASRLQERPQDSPQDSPRDAPHSRRVVKEVKEVTVTVERPNGLTTAQSLVGEYVDQVRALGAEPASRAKGQVARQIGELLSEGQPSETIRGAIGLLVERRLHPSTLPTLLLEATAGPGRRSNAKGVSAKEIFGMAGRQLEAGA